MVDQFHMAKQTLGMVQGTKKKKNSKKENRGSRKDTLFIFMTIWPKPTQVNFN